MLLSHLIQKANQEMPGIFERIDFVFSLPPALIIILQCSIIGFRPVNDLIFSASVFSKKQRLLPLSAISPY